MTCKLHGLDDLLHRVAVAQHEVMKIFLIDNADDAVNRLLIHRQARKACFRKEVGDFLHGARLIHGFHVYARRHDIDGFKVVG